MSRTPDPTADDWLDLRCACASTRRAARALTQLYDGFLREHGIEAAQFALLSTIQGLGPTSQIAVGRALGLDKTTLSRNVRVLVRAGWVEATTATSRERGIAVTAEGRRVLAAAGPSWQAAQSALRASIDAERWREVHVALRLLTDAARQATRTARHRRLG